jgi:imidazole glycerol-phosphate synthase subunit HisF
MLVRRIVPCLDIKEGRVVKGVRFVELIDAGDPVELARRYENEGADELVFLDITATVEGRQATLDVVRAVAAELTIPFAVGGGVKTVEDMNDLLRAGCDKVSVNSAALRNPELIDEAARRFGAQCVVVAIDVRTVNGRFEVVVDGGRTPTGRDAIEWAREAERRGAGELLVTSIDRDGTRAGYDLELTRAVAAAVDVPVVASGGAGSPADVRDVLESGGADAALVAGMLHDGATTVRAIKECLAASGLPVRAIA